MEHTSDHYPLKGIRVLDFGHTVMGPSCGLILADMGADVIKVEPVGEGDPTRRLSGFGSGYFGFFARNKRSLSIDLKSEQGLKITKKLVLTADIVIENFAPGTMDRLGLGYQTLAELNPKLIYASLKGFLPGPYGDRLALDEVVQMMGGLAFMTGPSGKPLRAGTSVVDIAGGMFAVIGILSALRSRDQTGQGQLVETALYEALVFLMGQHLCYASQSDTPIPPMPERVSAWSIYDIFQCRDDREIFLGITTDNHWQRFCNVVGWQDLALDKTLATNNQRIENKSRLMPIFSDFIAQRSLSEMSALCVQAQVPFAPVCCPEDLFEDEHLKATGGLLETRLPDGTATRLPRLPLRLSGKSFSQTSNPPVVGQDTRALLIQLGLSEADIADLIVQGVVQTDSDEIDLIKTDIQED